MANRASLRLAAGLLFLGLLLYILAGLVHPEWGADDHAAVFAEYAAHSRWTLTDLGRFAGMAGISAGLIVLFHALGVGAGAAGHLSRLGTAGTVAAFALYAALEAVDGVALQQAADAWLAAPAEEKAARYAAAEAVRWLQWGLHAYHSIVLGATLSLLAATILAGAELPMMLGGLVALTGLAYVAQGFIVGAQGFSRSNFIPTVIAYALWIVWAGWLRIAAWRTPVAS